MNYCRNSGQNMIVVNNSRHPSRENDREPSCSRPMLMSIENLGPTTRRCPDTPLSFHSNVPLPKSAVSNVNQASFCAPPTTPLPLRSLSYSRGGIVNGRPVSGRSPITGNPFSASNYGPILPFTPVKQQQQQSNQTSSQRTGKTKSKESPTNKNNNKDKIDVNDEGSALTFKKSEEDYKPARSTTSNKSRDNSKRATVTSTALCKPNSVLSGTPGYGYDCLLAPPLPYAWAPYSSPSQQRSCFSRKPFNYGAYPRLPGQRPQDPPCFSTTIANRSTPVVQPPAILPGPPYYTLPRKSTHQDTTMASYGALGDCNTRRSNISYNPSKPAINRPSDCGDEINYYYNE